VPTHPEQMWRAQVALAPDRLAFAAAEASGPVLVGAQTTWVEDNIGRWIPGEDVEHANRLGIVEWHTALISWADGGVIQISRDGQFWSSATVQPDEGNPSDVVPFGDQLVLLGEGTRHRVGAWRSADASTWTRVERSPMGMNAGAFLAGRGIVAVGWSGTNAAAWISSDALAWTPLGFPQPPGAVRSALTRVAAGEARVVAIGDVDGAAAVWSTDDLATWTRSAALGGDDTFLSSVAYGRGLFVIAGRSRGRPAIWESADGRLWSSVALPVAAGLSGEASDTTIEAGRLVVFGWATEDAGNGGTSRTAYLVWTLDSSR
jgi:hypothetical protein